MVAGAGFFTHGARPWGPKRWRRGREVACDRLHPWDKPMGVGKDPNGLAPLVNQISRLLVRAIKILDPCGLAPWVSEIMFHKLRAKPA